MSRIKVASLLVVALFLITALLSCKPSEIPPLPENPPPVPEEEQKSNVPESEVEVSGNESEARFVGPPAQQVLDIPKVEFPEVSSPDLTAMKNLVGTWRGNGVDFIIDAGNGQRVARTTWDVTLVINSQGEDNSVGGTLTMNTVKQEALVPQVFPVQNWGPDPLQNGKIEGTSLYFNIGTWEWSFTFTENLMSGQYVDPGLPGTCDAKAFVLTMQR